MFGVILLFLVVTILAFFRLLEFRDILNDITETSVPAVALSGQTYSQVNSLTYLTERLIKVDNLAAQRITNTQIQTQLLDLVELTSQNSTNIYLTTQLKAITIELSDLNDLVTKRLATEESFRKELLRIYQLYDSLLNSKNEMNDNDKSSEDLYYLKLGTANIVALAGRLDQLHRLHEVRQLALDINENIIAVEKESGRNTSISNKQKLDHSFNIFLELKEMILGERGLVNTRIKLLRVFGRANGRGNFMRSLIMDYASQAEYESFKLNHQVIESSKAASHKVKKQLQMVGIILVVAIIVLIFISVFLQRRVVGRLIRLNESVNKRLNGSVEDVVVSGNDEISDIAQTFNIFANTVELQKQTLQELSLKDGLTNIPNRRAFDEHLNTEISAAQRHNWPLSIIMIDVDFFKPYNDNYGHAKGDECLIQIAQTLEHALVRETDFIGRYGGEEFVCILPNTDREGATIIAEKLRLAIYNATIPHLFRENETRVTVSMGIATMPFQKDSFVEPEEFINNADQALYKAKASGRNRYVIYTG